jgi:glycosyltransferase involved in cell wall biosynthesis
MDSVRSVLFVLPATTVGGAETKFFNIIKLMAEVNAVLLTRRQVADYYKPLGITTYLFEDCGCPDDPMPFSPGKTLAYARAIAATCRREHFDCVVGIMHTGLFYISVARDLFRIKVPCMGTIEGPITAYFKSENRAPTLIERLLIRYLLARVPLIVVPSNGVGRDLVDNFGVAKTRIAVVLNGIDIVQIRSIAAHDSHFAERTGKLVMTACRLEPGKDFVTLLQAFRLVSEKVDATLVIVGDGPLREQITSDAREFGIGDRIVITGFQPNPFSYMRAADVFVLSSLFEGFGNVLVEAMALGVPVVSTDCPSGPAEVVENGLSGLLVPMRDPHSMAEAILRVLQDDSCNLILRRNGPLRAERFRADTMAEGFKREMDRIARDMRGADGSI